jgi:hypothetical protein
LASDFANVEVVPLPITGEATFAIKFRAEDVADVATLSAGL